MTPVQGRVRSMNMLGSDGLAGGDGGDLMAVKNPDKGDIIQAHRKSESDTGSAPVQIGVLTQRIRHLTEHLKRFPKDHATRRGLLRLVGRRASLMRYYARKQPTAYRELIQQLGIRG